MCRLIPNPSKLADKVADRMRWLMVGPPPHQFICGRSR
jgi:hypothetical protein